MFHRICFVSFLGDTEEEETTVEGLLKRMKLRDWTWRNGRRGENPKLAYCFPGKCALCVSSESLLELGLG